MSAVHEEVLAANQAYAESFGEKLRFQKLHNWQGIVSGNTFKSHFTLRLITALLSNANSIASSLHFL